MEPERIRPGEANSRMIESEVTDFPEPDSPTMPTVSPWLGKTDVVHGRERAFRRREFGDKTIDLEQGCINAKLQIPEGLGIHDKDDTRFSTFGWFVEKDG